jgi:hypothetical protein
MSKEILRISLYQQRRCGGREALVKGNVLAVVENTNGSIANNR